MSSLKKSLQPSVTDVGLNFYVPKGIQVVRAPDVIPPVFNGEKIVLYGLLKGAGNDKSGKCLAVLTGKMQGHDIRHEIDFQVEDGSVSSGLPIVHQLAAKSLIQDWGNSKKKMKKTDTIKLSIESSVVSSYTAYIAIDKDQHIPIDGAIKTFDITADTGELFHTVSKGRRIKSLQSRGLDSGGVGLLTMSLGPVTTKSFDPTRRCEEMSRSLNVMSERLRNDLIVFYVVLVTIQVNLPLLKWRSVKLTTTEMPWKPMCRLPIPISRF